MNGFCNDITRGCVGPIYATDSWYPARPPAHPGCAGAAVLDELAGDASAVVRRRDQWHLNGIDYDAAGNDLYVVENHPGHL